MDIENIKQEMKRKKITQIELAKISNVPLQTVKYILTGRTPHPRIDTMQAIEKALGLADGSPLENAKVGEMLNEKERRLITAFRGLVEPMQDIMLEQIEKMAKVRETV